MPTPGNSGKRVITIKPLHVNTTAVKFSSLMTQYADTWTPQWRQEFVYGRMDPISFYAGTDRKITLGFRVVSESRSEATTNMRAIERLLQFQYPTFESQQDTTIATVKAPPYFEVKLFNVANVGSQHIQGYFNGPITINPGFGDKTKNQYYNNSHTKLFFSDVEIVLQMVVLHQKNVGFYGNKFGGLGHAYPYNIGGTTEGVAEVQREQEASAEEAHQIVQEYNNAVEALNAENPAPVNTTPTEVDESTLTTILNTPEYNGTHLWRRPDLMRLRGE